MHPHVHYIRILFACMLISACGDSGHSSADLVSPSDPNALSQVLVIPGARRVQGQPPPSSNSPDAPRITGGTPQSVTSGQQAVLSIDFESPTGYNNCYVQVDGANDYFAIEGNDTTTEGQLQIPVNVPSFVDSGSFSLSTSIAGTNGVASNRIQTTIQVSRPTRGGEGGNQEICSLIASQSAMACNLEFCGTADTSGTLRDCAYVVDGNRIDCADCQQFNVQVCADLAVDACLDSRENCTFMTNCVSVVLAFPQGGGNCEGMMTGSFTNNCQAEVSCEYEFVRPDGTKEYGGGFDFGPGETHGGAFGGAWTCGMANGTTITHKCALATDSWQCYELP